MGGVPDKKICPNCADDGREVGLAAPDDAVTGCGENADIGCCAPTWKPGIEPFPLEGEAEANTDRGAVAGADGSGAFVEAPNRSASSSTSASGTTR